MSESDSTISTIRSCQRVNWQSQKQIETASAHKRPTIIIRVSRSVNNSYRKSFSSVSPTPFDLSFVLSFYQTSFVDRYKLKQSTFDTRMKLKSLRSEFTHTKVCFRCVVNRSVVNKERATWSSLPTAPNNAAAWLSSSISNPYAWLIPYEPRHGSPFASATGLWGFSSQSQANAVPDFGWHGILVCICTTHVKLNVSTDVAYLVGCASPNRPK